MYMYVGKRICERRKKEEGNEGIYVYVSSIYIYIYI
jgi:hypothetical protein